MQERNEINKQSDVNDLIESFTVPYKLTEMLEKIGGGMELGHCSKCAEDSMRCTHYVLGENSLVMDLLCDCEQAYIITFSVEEGGSLRGESFEVYLGKFS
jgi:hypothetical protein